MADQKTPWDDQIASLDPVCTREEASLYASLVDKNEGYHRGVAAKQDQCTELGMAVAHRMEQLEQALADERAKGAALVEALIQLRAQYKSEIPLVFGRTASFQEPWDWGDNLGLQMADAALAAYHASQGPEESHAE